MEYRQNCQKKAPEILAPAGSYDGFRAALLAGADAVYAGGPRFGARAYAQNFTEAQLAEAVEEAHLHHRRFYLTVNTLVKEKEFPALFEFLSPLYEKGLDAVIVQDIGVFELVRSCFPEMEIHASTQMTVTGAAGARFLKECGAVRVVPARELSLEEVRHLKQETGMEVECFVHGALCYCYSGQCLMSSLIGGRSGNRGQCAQPCRLPYSAGKKKGYLLSLKDICTLELIPDLMEAGIDSFKIEGRMKQPEYVAGVTAMYRKYVDRYLAEGRKGFHVENQDLEVLQDLYNRGGFHTGYYRQKNGREMLAIDRPNHTGTAVGTVTAQKGREAELRIETRIRKGDVMELPGKGLRKNYTFGQELEKGQTARILLPKGVRLAPGRTLYRIRNEKLLTEWKEFREFGKIQEKIYGFLRLISGKPATLVVCSGEVSVEVCSDVPVEKASRSPLDEARLRRQLEKTGNTEFLFAQLDLEMEPDVFLPMQQINLLRRKALELLRRKLSGRYYRNPPKKAWQDTKQKPSVSENLPFLSVLVTNREQLEAVSGCCGISRVYVESSMEDEICRSHTQHAPDPETGRKYSVSGEEALQNLKKSGAEVYLALPHIFREKTQRWFEASLETSLWEKYDGVLLRNYESIAFWQSPEVKAKIGFDKKLILDHNLYVGNPWAKAFWQDRGIHDFTAPVEWNRQELCTLDVGQMELFVYGYLPVMISAQCVGNTIEGCKNSGKSPVLTDRYQKHFPVEKRCRECYNILYNPVPLCLFGEREALGELSPGSLRLQFSVENGQETRQVVNACIQAFSNPNSVVWQPEKFTHGHFRRGVI